MYLSKTMYAVLITVTTIKCLKQKNHPIIKFPSFNLFHEEEPAGTTRFSFTLISFYWALTYLILRWRSILLYLIFFVLFLKISLFLSLIVQFTYHIELISLTISVRKACKIAQWSGGLAWVNVQRVVVALSPTVGQHKFTHAPPNAARMNRMKERKVYARITE